MNGSIQRSINLGQGSKTVQKLIEGGRLQRVTASRDHAERLLKQSSNHLISAAKLSIQDPEGAYSALYDAARKALVAVLEVQGLRPTTKGGHVVVGQALGVQIDPPFDEIIPPFNRMRKLRNAQEYPGIEEPELTTLDVLEDLEKAKGIVALAHELINQFLVFN